MQAVERRYNMVPGSRRATEVEGGEDKKGANLMRVLRSSVDTARNCGSRSERKVYEDATNGMAWNGWWSLHSGDMG